MTGKEFFGKIWEGIKTLSSSLKGQGDLVLVATPYIFAAMIVSIAVGTLIYIVYIHMKYGPEPPKKRKVFPPLCSENMEWAMHNAEIMCIEDHAKEAAEVAVAKTMHCSPFYKVTHIPAIRYLRPYMHFHLGGYQGIHWKTKPEKSCKLTHEELELYREAKVLEEEQAELEKHLQLPLSYKYLAVQENSRHLSKAWYFLRPNKTTEHVEYVYKWDGPSMC